MNKTLCFSYFKSKKVSFLLRNVSSGIWDEPNVTVPIKLRIEEKWKDRINLQENNKNGEKFYVLSMFPYPSGKLHIGHARIYSVNDALARYYRMHGKNVIQPMGWDAFGLPAENAAIDHKITPEKWTRENISHMKHQLQQLGCCFDWSREFATCDPSYYKWTQYLFLKMYENDLVYQKEALVNWDPVDETVLADEQVDSNGCSWRSGAKVEKKPLKQWFIRTTRFAKSLLDGLSDPILEQWKDIISLQKHWIGTCNGVLFDFPLNDRSGQKLTVWTRYPEFIESVSFIALPYTSRLGLKYKGGQTQKLDFTAKNPFTGQDIPIFITDDIVYETGNDNHLGIPGVSPEDREFAIENEVEIIEPTKPPKNEAEKIYLQNLICQRARELHLGGDWTSSKLRDWLISRQRYWGTPIPIVHCKDCGCQPVPEWQLPVELPKIATLSRKGISPLADAEEWLRTTCPKCGGAANREIDTMDTFFDSSWYFLRFMDPKNDQEPFSQDAVRKMSPVDLYLGGKEHAVLHLYYARFVHHFLHSLSLVPEREPFKRLMVLGMVMGRSFRLKGTGRYLLESAVMNIDVKKGKALTVDGKEPVVVAWEKMSKSKLNGVDPENMFKEYSVDTVRLLILADVAPTSPRNWNSSTFPGIINWQKRLWLTMQDFYRHRTSNLSRSESEEFRAGDSKLYDARNYYLTGVAFNYHHSQQLSVAISKMQGLTNSLRQAKPEVIAHSPQYERALATQIIMLAPLAPHFASELWERFTSTPNRINLNEFQWDKMVLDQQWPQVDDHYQCSVLVKINGVENSSFQLPRVDLDRLTKEKALDLALTQRAVLEEINRRTIGNVFFHLYKGIKCEINIYLDMKSKIKLEN